MNMAKSAGDAGDAAKTSSHRTGQDSDGATPTGCAESYLSYRYSVRISTLELEASLILEILSAAFAFSPRADVPES